ncbi:MAG: hypothetical protein IPK16_33355 [Anaerolineales bacterium]|nr:hypothetical protein [Anaerolineales bacterium]
MARKILENVLSGLMQQLNIVQDQALAPMRAMVQQVVGGIWIGQGANAFVEEVSSLMIPGVGQVMDHITFMSSNLQRAMDIIDDADKQAQSMASSLGDTFGNIVNF